jgi:hypothetical protein
VSTMSDCPTCERSFSSELGMKQHHKQTHGESISGELVECAFCGENFRTPSNRVKDNNFCKPECHNKWMSNNQTGEGNPAWDGGMVETTCDNCGKDLQRKPCREESKHFCNQVCQGEWRSENLTGQDSWAYKDGSSLENYYNTQSWKQFKREMRDELDTDCQICGEIRDRQNALHHIIRMGDFENREDANFEENVVFLCQSHHMELENQSVEKQMERLNTVPHLPNSVSELTDAAESNRTKTIKCDSDK